MTTQKNVAIIYKDQEVINILAEFAHLLGYSTSTMLVDRRTKPYQVVSFIEGVIPDLVLLAENYQYSQFNPDVGKRGSWIGEGIDALVEIRKKYPKQKLPIYMVSGGPLHRERAMREDANGYLKIPVKFEEFKQFLDCSNLVDTTAFKQI